MKIKKFFSLVMLAFLSIALFSCDEEEVTTPTLSLPVSEVELLVGENYEIVPTIKDLEGTDLYTIEVSDPSVISLSANTITALKAGTAMVTVTLKDYQDISKSIEVVVKEVPSITINEGERTVMVSGTITLSATLNNASGTITWESKDTTIATITSSGVVTGVKEGKVTMVAKYEKYEAECEITVTAIPRITISGEQSVYVGSRITLTASLENLEGKIEWTTSDKEIARVINGNVDGLKEGKVTITATCGEYMDQYEIEVKPIPTVKITGESEVITGKTITLTATLNGVAGEIIWTVDNEEIATIDDQGVLTGVSTGTVKVTATCDKYTASINIEVKPQTFTVTFKDSEGADIIEVEVLEGEGATAPAAPEKEGYRFVSWDVEFANVTEDLVVTAVYAQTYSIVYHLNDGEFFDSNLAPKEFIKDEKVTLVNPIKTGYKFVGWTLEEGTTTYVTEITGGEVEVNLYAVWRERNTTNIFTVGPDELYNTIAMALEDARDGASITLLPGTYNENVTISLNNVTIKGPNAEINPINGTRVEEAIITGKIIVAANNLTISGIKFTAENCVKLNGGNNTFVFENNVVEAASTTVGTSASGVGQIQASGDVANLIVKNNKFTLKAGVAYYSCIYTTGKVTNAEITDNYFTNTYAASANVFAVWLPRIAGDIEVNNNDFYRFAGNYWTVWLGQTNVAENTIIDILDNTIDSVASDTCACGIAVDNLTSSTIYLNIIGNTFSFCKDTVIGLRGTGSTDTTSTPNVTIKYNKVLNTSARMRFCMADTNFYFGNNYTFAEYTDQGTPNIIASTVATDDYESTDLLDAAYATYKEQYASPYGLVTYVTNGGVVVASKRYLIGVEFTLPVATYEGYKFVGWTKEEAGTDYLTKIESTERGDLTLYAHWEKIISFDVTYNYNGGVSEELYIASGSTDLSLVIDNYNNNEGTFWGGGYASYIYITDSGSDPKATFSDRIYIGINDVSGMYEIVSILTSGASSWPANAQYVISISSSYSGYRDAHAIVQELSVGQVVAFSKAITAITDASPATVYFYSEAPAQSTITIKVTSNDSLVAPSKLGYAFLGWYDNENNLYETVEDLNSNINLYAKWQELNPVTDIEVTSICTEMETDETFQIVAKVLPTDAFFQSLFYSSSNKDVVAVDENGLLKAVNAGTATITITDYVGKIVKTFEIVVNPISSIDLEASNFEDNVLSVGDKINITPTAVGKDSANVTYTYLSSDVTVAVVSATGEVTATSVGCVEIIITDSRGKTLRVGITVKEKSNEETIDKIIDLIAQNNFAVVETGNACLYNDGHDRYYDSMYGSVNKYLFASLVKDTTYVEQATNNSGGHQDRDPADSIQFVTVHDTATLTGTAAAIANNMSSGETSIHYVVGNNKVYTVVPEKYIAYHAGDGTGVEFAWYDTGVAAATSEKPKIEITEVSGSYYFVVNGTTTSLRVPISNGSKTIANPSNSNLANLGPVWKIENGKYYIGKTWACFSQVAAGVISSYGGNNNSIGIEMCVNMSGDLYDTWQRTASLVADILIRNNLDLTRVQQHNTWTGKNCPQSIIAGNYWDSFMEMVALNYDLQKNYSEAEITMVSNNPSIVDNTGRVIKAPAVTTSVSYTVTVKVGSDSKTITLYSVIPGTTTWTQWDGTYKTSNIWNNGSFAR